MSKRTKKLPSPVRTSPQRRGLSIGSSPVSAHEEERMRYLLTIFESIDLNQDKQMSFEEFHGFLSKQQGEEFDYILCQELFARLDKDNDELVSIDEFVSNYVEVENLIIKQIRTVNKEIQKFEGSVRENKEKLTREKGVEVLKSNGVMQGSYLTVTVKTAIGLYPTTADGLCNAFVTLECDGSSFATQMIPSTLSPVWDEMFEIPINNKGIELNLTIQSKSALGTKFVGKVSIPLRTLADQMLKEQYYNLLSENGQPWQGKILLEHQWMWSKVKFYTDIINQQEKFIQEDKEKVESLKAQREKLMRPFGIDTGGIDFIHDHSVSGTSQVIGPIDPIEPIVKWSEHTRFVVGLIYVYLILIIFNNFKRTDFVNVRTN